MELSNEEGERKKEKRGEEDAVTEREGTTG